MGWYSLLILAPVLLVALFLGLAILSAELPAESAKDNSAGAYILPNGHPLMPGCRVRVSEEDIWKIPQEDVEKYGLELEAEATSPGSEVIYRRLVP